MKDKIMYKNIILLFFVINLLKTNILAQNMWQLTEPDNGSIVNSLSLDSLMNIIQYDEDGWNSNPNLYEDAVIFLLNNYKNSGSEFLLENLNTKIDNTIEGPFKFFQWQKYYVDQYAKGILGDTNAILSMDSIARFCPDDFYKLLAIRRLAEIGYFNYWNIVKNNKDRLNGRVTFLIYGKDLEYRKEVLDTLESELIKINSQNWEKIISLCEDIYFIDSSFGIEKLNEYFQNSSGLMRYNYFFQLGILDKGGQVNRTIFAIMNESNDSVRAEFIPRYSSIKNNLNSTLYLEPNFINNLINIIGIDLNSITYNKIKQFLKSFIPLPPDSAIATNYLLDNLNNYVDSVFNYTWLGDVSFSNELKNVLTTAQTNLQNGDSLACRVQVKAFQELVDNVYKDSLNADPRFVTIEGWKFLYWNAQYILDRLPEPPANPNLVVNLKNSLGNQIPASNVKYYEGSWKDAVNNGDGTFTVITTRPTVSIRVFYEGANQTVNDVPAQNNTYTFTTVNAAVQLKNSFGNLIDVGTVQYYAGAWRSFGSTSNGVANKELLPINYNFRMTYEFVSKDKQQNLSANPVVDFSTVLCSVKVSKTTNNQPINNAAVKYYSGAWRNLGTTNTTGIAAKELIPATLSFRATVGNVTQDKQQDISVNNLVEILLNIP